jgi:ATP-independent RNA helicase DbpA
VTQPAVPAFSALQLPPALARAIQARTGSGKTVAFGLGLLARTDVERNGVQALVLCPTRELADQVATEVRRLARFVPNLRVVTLCGGVPVRTQAASLQVPPQVVVGTPGRILDHLQRGTIDLASLQVLVLDEADRMLDMGFLEAITAVVEQAPAARQTLLFSATWPDGIRALSRSLQRDPLAVTVDTVAPADDIEQLFFAVEPGHKAAALAALLLQYRPDSALVFCPTRNDVRDVAAGLQQRGFSVLALHGEMEQRERDEALLRFANRSCAVLVATDVAARGLDIKELAAVVSWELPADPDVHLHRIGRTGRAGQKGLALALCAPRELARLGALEMRAGVPAKWGELPASSGQAPAPPPMTTLTIDGGRQDKLRAGDLLGALTGDVGLPGDAIGKIDIAARRAYVAVRTERAEQALRGLRAGKIKGRTFRVSRLG